MNTLDTEVKGTLSELIDYYDTEHKDNGNCNMGGGGNTDIITQKKDITSVLRITKYEFPVIISTRTLQIDKGSKVFINNPDQYSNSQGIAMEEFKRDLIPFILKRPINKDKGIYENIKIIDLYHPLKYKNN